MKSFNIHKNDKEETEKPNEEVEKRMNISSQSTSYDEYEEDNTQKKFTKITRRSKFQKIVFFILIYFLFLNCRKYIIFFFCFSRKI